MQRTILGRIYAYQLSSKPMLEKTLQKFIFLNKLKIPTCVVFLFKIPMSQTTPQFGFTCKRCELLRIQAQLIPKKRN